MSAIADSISVTGTTEAADRRRRIVAIVGASSGNLVEWYDFYAYAFTSIYFASAFFPSGDADEPAARHRGNFRGRLFHAAAGRLAVRLDRRHAWPPHVDDHLGADDVRGSLMIAVMPTYATIGAAAPVFLLVARLTQGLSVGGEYGTARHLHERGRLQGKPRILLLVPVRDAHRRTVAAPCWCSPSCRSC